MANRGLMAENMFVGQSVLLKWLNDALQTRLEKIEDTCSGAVACQLMDCLHPGSVNMKKVDFNVNQEYQFTQNYKVLQDAFTKCGIDRAFNVAALSKGKRQDNNEFMQWFKGYWDSITGGQDIDDYDAVSRREISKTGDWKKFSLASAGVRPSGDTIAAVRRAPVSAARNKPALGSSSARSNLKMASAGPSIAAIAQLEEEIAALRIQVETAERERDFYFDKLRDVEVVCQAPDLQDLPAVKIIEKVLYAADSAEAKQVLQESATQLGMQFAPGEEEVACQ